MNSTEIDQTAYNANIPMDADDDWNDHEFDWSDTRKPAHDTRPWWRKLVGWLLADDE